MSCSCAAMRQQEGAIASLHVSLFPLVLITYCELAFCSDIFSATFQHLLTLCSLGLSRNKSVPAISHSQANTANCQLVYLSLGDFMHVMAPIYCNPGHRNQCLTGMMAISVFWNNLHTPIFLTSLGRSPRTIIVLRTDTG